MELYLFCVFCPYDFFPIANTDSSVDTKDKIYIDVTDNRGAFANKSEAVLLEQFEKELNIIYVGLFSIAPDMDTDIVVKLFDMDNVPLAYFCQGEYHLWGD